MPHSIILSIEKLDCIASRFPSIATEIANLKSTAADAEANLATLAKEPPQHEIHTILHQVQTWATERCDNWTAYVGCEAQMATNAQTFIEDLTALM